MHERILVETAMAMIDVVRADEMGRLQICCRPRLRRDRAGSVPQPLSALLQHDLRQPGGAGRLSGATLELTRVAPSVR